jgi:hypothetical protein
MLAATVQVASKPFQRRKSIWASQFLLAHIMASGRIMILFAPMYASMNPKTATLLGSGPIKGIPTAVFL